MQLGHIVPDRGESRGHGTATHQPPGTHVEGASEGDPMGGDLHERSGGECQCSGGLATFVEH